MRVIFCNLFLTMPDSNNAPDHRDGIGSHQGPPSLNLETLRYFGPFLSQHWKRLWACLAILILTSTQSAVMGLLPAFLTRYWQPDGVAMLLWGIGALMAYRLIMFALEALESYWFAYISQCFSRDARLAIYRKMGRIPAGAMGQQSIGELAQRSTGDVMRIQNWVAPLMPTAVSDVLQVLFVGGALFWLSPGFALILIPSILVGNWLLVKVRAKLRSLARECQLRSEGLLTRFIEGASGYRDLVASGRFRHAADRFGEELDGLRVTAVRMTMAGYFAGAIPALAFMLLFFGFYFFKLSDGAEAGDVVYLGKVMSFAALLMNFQGPLLSLAYFFNETAMASPSFNALRSLLEMPEVADNPGGESPKDGQVTVADLTFSYHPEQTPVLNNLNFNIPDGSFTAIIGQTGSGKTTLFLLLLRLLEPNSGVLKIGGVPLRDVGLLDLRESIGFIPQAPFIFDASIRENILMGLSEEEVGIERLEKAIHLAQLDGLIEGRKESGGMDAPVGPNGASLSGGERQRIALARVFLRDPKVIVCDEYTANIDNATARLIQEALALHFAGRTRIAITHQLYTVRNADHIVVLENGEISGMGSHEELLEKPGLYKDLWEVQSLS